MTPEEFSRLKRLVEQNNREADREEGQVSQIMFQIQEEFGEGSLAAARKRLKRMEKELLAAEARADKLKGEFLEEHGEGLGLGE